MTLLLKRISLVALSFQHNLRCLDLERLLVIRSSYILSGHRNSSAGQVLSDFCKIRQRLLIDDLGILEIRTVIQCQKSDILASPVRSDPALQEHIFHLVLLQLGPFIRQFIQFPDRHFTQHSILRSLLTAVYFCMEFASKTSS